MPESLPDFLKHRAERSFHYLLRETDAISEADALRFARPDWPAHRFGIGQNGSIAGIVYHVAAWKQLTLPLFTPGGTMLPTETLENSAPMRDDWQGIRAWLQQIGTEWNAELFARTDADFDRTHQWEKQTIRLSEYVMELIEHDVQHAAQIEYLRQRLRVEL